MHVVVLYKEYVHILLNILNKRRDRSDTSEKVKKCNAKEEDDSKNSNSNKAWKENEQGICPRLRIRHSMNLVKEETLPPPRPYQSVAFFLCLALQA